MAESISYINFDRDVRVIAVACHEQNRAWCIAHGDNSQPHWDEAPLWQRKSAIDGVRFVLKDPSPIHSHERWASEKLRDGWKYGEIEDLEAKTHHCLVTYEQLSEEHRMQYTLFIQLVQQMAKAFQI